MCLIWSDNKVSKGDCKTVKFGYEQDGIITETTDRGFSTVEASM